MLLSRRPLRGRSVSPQTADGPLVATVGSFAALLTINRIVGIGEDQAGQVHLFDGEKMSWRAIRIPADPGCKACASV